LSTPSDRNEFISACFQNLNTLNLSTEQSTQNIAFVFVAEISGKVESLLHLCACEATTEVTPWRKYRHEEVMGVISLAKIQLGLRCRGDKQ